MKTYKLTKTKKGSNNIYVVTDQTGTILSKRVSKRDYVACTINGRFYFGRLDLVGKGDHGRSLNFYQGKPDRKEEFEAISQIAYLEE